MSVNLNPRVLCFLHVHKLPLSTVRLTDADLLNDVTRIDIGNGLMPWTIEFSCWVRARWEDWATGLGYKRGHGSSAAENALMAHLTIASGTRSALHTAADFDVWLWKESGL